MSTGPVFVRGRLGPAPLRVPGAWRASPLPLRGLPLACPAAWQKSAPRSPGPQAAPSAGDPEPPRVASAAGEGQWVQVRRYSLQGRSLPPVSPLLPPAHAPRTLLICLFIIYPQPDSQKARRHLLKSCSPKLGCAPGSLGLQAQILPRGSQVPPAQPGSQGPPDPAPKGGLSRHP